MDNRLRVRRVCQAGQFQLETRLRTDQTDTQQRNRQVYVARCSATAMTRDELSAKLDELPCTFTDVSLYFKLELLEEARAARWFVFEPRFASSLARRHSPR